MHNTGNSIMSVSKQYYYVKRVLHVGQLAMVLKEIADDFAFNPDLVTFSFSEKLPDATNNSKDRITLQDLESICDLSEKEVKMQLTSKNEEHIYIDLRGADDYFELRIYCHEPYLLNEISEKFKNLLTLEETASPFEKLRSLSKNIIQEINVSEKKYVLKCFLSYRFSSGSENIALRVQRFLTLLDVDVLTGSSYEPRRISEKVLSKLKQPLDFIVLLVTCEGESMWTRDEVGAALHAGIPVVPLVEDGAQFNSGLFADLEYIPFSSGHIGDAFLKLLEAVKFIRYQMVNSKPASLER